MFNKPAELSRVAESRCQKTNTFWKNNGMHLNTLNIHSRIPGPFTFQELYHNSIKQLARKVRAKCTQEIQKMIWNIKKSCAKLLRKNITSSWWFEHGNCSSTPAEVLDQGWDAPAVCDRSASRNRAILGFFSVIKSYRSNRDLHPPAEKIWRLSPSSTIRKYRVQFLWEYIFSPSSHHLPLHC